jgi:hypothetical protein
MRTKEMLGWMFDQSEISQTLPNMVSKQPTMLAH